MAQQKIQSIQLTDTGVIPGSYVSSNITVDSSGRITAVVSGSDETPRLTARKIIYVRTDGNDANDGSADDAAHAFLTGTAAYKKACQYQLAAGFDIVIQLGTGTFTSISCQGGPYGSLEGNGNPGTWLPAVTIRGNGAANTSIIRNTAGASISGILIVGAGARVRIRDLKIGGGGPNANGICTIEGGILDVATGIEFGAITGWHMLAQELSTIYRYNPYTVSGGGAGHIYAWGGGYVEGGTAVTFTSPVTFTDSFVRSEGESYIYDFQGTFPGSAVTGVRFRAMGGVIESWLNSTDFASLTYFPGTVGGVIDWGGRYNDFLDAAPVTLTGDATGTGTGVVPVTLANTGVIAGSYTNTNITVDAKGRITSASTGTGGGGGGGDSAPVDEIIFGTGTGITSSPNLVYNASVLKLLATGGRINVSDGSITGPTYSFNSNPLTGLYLPASNVLGITTFGVERARIDATGLAVTGVVRGSSGSASVPSLSFTTETSMGMYRSTTSTLGFSTSSTERLTINSSGIKATVVYQSPQGTAGAPAYSFTGATDIGMYLVNLTTLAVSAQAGERQRWDAAYGTQIAGVVRAGDGSITTPAYSFTSDIDTGLISAGVNTLGIVTSGVERLRINATGSWGLAVTNYGIVGQVLTSGGSTAPPTWTSPATGSTITLEGDVTGSGTGTITTTLANTTVGAGSYTNANITVDSKGRITSASNGSTGGGGLPAGATTQIQFNDGGAFGAVSSFVWDKVTNTMIVGAAATPGIIRGPQGAATSPGVDLTIIAGPGGATSGTGGTLFLTGGRGIGTAQRGGSVNITGGFSTIGGSTKGGDVNITSGFGGQNSTGGDINIVADGGSTNSLGGTINIRGTDLYGSPIVIAGGSKAGGTGGAVTIRGGLGSTSASGGSMTVAGGEGIGGNGGPATFQGGDGNGNGVLGGTVTLRGGHSTRSTIAGSFPGSLVFVRGGDALGNTNSGAGGEVQIQGGTGGVSNGAGGSVLVRGGPGTGTGARGNVELGGAGTALATTATGGFITVPTTSGTPTGVPLNVTTGQVALVFDTTSNKLYVYDAGWVDTSTGGSFTLTGDVTGTGSGTVATTVAQIGGQPISLAGSFTTSGANPLTLTTTGATNVTLPTTGTLASSGVNNNFTVGQTITTGAATALSLTSSGATATETLTDTGVNGVNLTLTGSGATTPSKTIRVANGTFFIRNSANTTNILSLTDAGALTVPSTISASNFTGSTSGTNTGDQTITLTGDVTGTGTGSFAATVGQIGGKAIVLGGPFTTVGASALTLTTTGVTNATFPTGTTTVAVRSVNNSFTVGQTITTAALPSLNLVSQDSAETLALTDTGTTAGVNIKMTGSAGTGVSKWIRVQAGLFSIRNNANTANLFSISDAGNAQIVNPAAGGAPLYLGSVDSQSTLHVQDTGTSGANIRLSGNATGGAANKYLRAFDSKFEIRSSSYTTTILSLTDAGALSVIGTITGSNLSGTNTGDQSITLTGDVTGGPSTGSITTTLATVGTVTPGSYINANITVDSKGRVTAAANGSAGGTPPGGANTELQYNNSGAFAGLANAAANNALISAGTSTLPTWGKIGLTTHVTGLLPIANGGTGAASASAALTALGGITSVAAQTIVDTAFNNVGLGGQSADISSTNLDTRYLNAFYRGTSLTNAPDSGTWFVFVEQENNADNLNVKQIATAYGIGPARPTYTAGAQFMRMRSNGTWGGWVPITNQVAGANTQIQFNDSGVLGGDADFVWNKTTNTVTVGSAATPGIIRSPQGSASAAGVSLTVIAGAGGATAGVGGIVNVTGGAGTAAAARGGAVQITGGQGGVTSGSGGNVLITGGPPQGTGVRGNVELAVTNATIATTATSGFVTIPTCLGVPTGVPANVSTGQAAMVYDGTNNHLYIYSNGAWNRIGVAIYG